ncbi:MAG TPA: CBS domain-containing protein [Pirellulales bacterium]|jgi:CBS domain-containing protein|nr:CBS domain-containing protein [Pirellulales bacterium]
MILNDILRLKGSEVYHIIPTATLGDVVHEMMRRRCGALLVCSGPDCGRGIVGIITERDILRACAERNGSISNIPVGEYMTMDMVTGTPDNSVEYIMGVMTDHRIRHLPVLDGDQLVGVISIGDLVKAQHHQTIVENHYLKSYIQS